MEYISKHFDSSLWSAPAAAAALTATAVSLLALVVLHFVSPEFDVSWRMVSEYANGHHPNILTLMFVAWSLSSFALLVALWPLSSSVLGKIGLACLFLAAIGEIFGAVFDINHKLHGVAFSSACQGFAWQPSF